MGGWSRYMEQTGNGRVGDYWLSGDGRVFYTYRSWGDTTPDSDNFNYGYIYTTECLENPNPALIYRLKGETNPDIIGFNIEIPHTTKDWSSYWCQKFSYATEEDQKTEGRGSLVNYLKYKAEQELVVDTDSDTFKALIPDSLKPKH